MIIVGFCAVATAGAVLLLLVRRRYLVVTVDGRSMEPTYRPGQRVLVRRLPAQSVRTGQVVVLRAPQPADPFDIPGVPRERVFMVAPDDRLFLKRLVAGPGDPVPRASVPPLRHVPEPVVPAARFVVLGDNAAISYDSREYGYVPADLLVGVALRTLT
jgi:signal peptidase I